MKTSIKGMVAIARHEGIVPAPYLDLAGIWTFGIGHAETANAPPKPSQMPRGMPGDLDAAIKLAFDLFRVRLADYERGVLAAIKVPLQQHEFDALVSLCYNIGPAALARSSVARHLNASDRERAAAAFGAWNKAGGKVMPGLVARRRDEANLFLTGDYGAGPVPVYEVKADNRIGRVIRRYSATEVEAMLAKPSPAPAPDRQPRMSLAAIIIAALIAAGAAIFGGWE